MATMMTEDQTTRVCQATINGCGGSATESQMAVAMRYAERAILDYQLVLGAMEGEFGIGVDAAGEVRFCLPERDKRKASTQER
jgi:hypothetical protein